MNVTEYIKSKPELDALNFRAVYQTIILLIADGMLSMDDFNKVKPVSADGFYKIQNKESKKYGV
jgi:hypothetical protein